ncbi:MAG: tRNA (adenosine(37)-N6)-threonylcarbamoyltransferase complex dimerization subunit type 1 TsaB [Planctomycetota bacterium]|nr:tRNA (adenosine(37)-N6)-threonylcarbamoyltransferase complex dimerization subunit type 1 TsaB [Planctomycetota bacterium]
MKPVLAIETSSHKGGISLTDGTTLLASEYLPSQIHTKELIPAIKRLLLSHNLTFNSLSLVAVDVGPGSFTGVRIGLTCAKFISYLTSAPLVGVVSTDAIARRLFEESRKRQKPPEQITVVLDAYRGMLYCALYDENGNRRMLDLLSPESVKQYISSNSIVCGYGVERYKKELSLKRETTAPETYHYPDPLYIALLGLHKFEIEKRDESKTVAPLYLRPSEAEERRGLALKPEDLHLEGE